MTGTIRKRIKKLTRDTTVRPSLPELLSFWESMNDPGRLARLVGFLLLVLAGIGIGFLGSSRIQYAKEFYPLTISTEFLEDMKTGTKVRYQGALVVGEVTAIETDGRSHLIHIKVKKDFPVPKMGSQVSLSTWGYFGSKFINIDILEDARGSEPWPPGSVIPMQPMVNSSVIMQRAFDYFKRESSGNSMLENQLLEVREMSRTIARSPFARPREVRRFIQDITSRSQLFLIGMQELGNSFYSAASGINEYSEDMTISLQKSIARMRELTESFRRVIGYDTGTMSSRILHEETEYEALLSYLKYVRRKSAEFRREPYRVFFD